MPVSIVDPASTELRHLTSVDVKFSGIHIGGGIYFSANHYPTPGGTSKAIPQRSLDGEIEQHDTVEIDYTLPQGDDPWTAYRDDLNGDGTPDAIKAGYDMSMHVGDLLSTGSFYDGPAIPLLIANDPTDLSGLVYITGYPGSAVSLDGQEGTLHETSGTLAGYTGQDVSGDLGGYYTVQDAQALTGMSGGGGFLDWDPDGDGYAQTYAIGTVSRALTYDYPDPIPDEYAVQLTSFSPNFADLAAAIEGLTGADARTADDFARMTLLSGQSAGSSLTTVEGQFFHEDIYGGVNADTLNGGGGNDSLFGADGADLLKGGTGNDSLSGGSGDDTLEGGSGADLFVAGGFGDGATDRVTDFDSAEDVLDLSLFFADIADVMAAATENPDGSLSIDLSQGTEVAALAGGTVILDNMVKSALGGANLMVACFTQGTLILTARGPMPIEALIPGTRVWTRDHWLQRVHHIYARSFTRKAMGRNPQLCPVRIRAGALGPGRPARDMLVSPQHRMLVTGEVVQRMLGVPEALVPACKLTPLPGIRQIWPDHPVVYIHLAFARHEIIEADGCLTESFYPGDAALGTLPPETVAEYRALFGVPKPVRPLVEEARATRLVIRHRRNAKPLQSRSTAATSVERGEGRSNGLGPSAFEGAWRRVLQDA